MRNLFVLRIIRARPVFFAGYAIGFASFFVLTPVPSVAPRAVLAWDIGSCIFFGLQRHLVPAYQGP